MIRSILGTKRIPDETYVEWIIRATDIAEEACVHYNVPDWIEEVHRRVFQWAGHTARRTDGRWTREVLQWSVEGKRKRGHPVTRWSDSINRFFVQVLEYRRQTVQKRNSFWMSIAEDRDTWKDLEEDYIKCVLG